MRDVRGNLWRYPVFQTVMMTPFFVPVVVLFWRENGLDAFDIYVLQGLFAIAVVILEVPTGTVADRLGKKASLLVGSLSLVAGFVIYALSSSFLSFLVGEIVLAFGVSLVSGADSALLYDSLKRLDRVDEYSRREGTARALQLVSVAACSVAGGFVGDVSLRATLWLSVIGPAISVIIALGFVEAGERADEEADESAPRPSYWSIVSAALKFVGKHRLVRWYVLFFAVLTGSSTWLLWLYQPYMEWTGLPVYIFGIAFAIFNLAAAGASKIAYRFDERLGPKGGIIGLMVLQVAPLLLMAFVVTPLSFLFIIGHQAVRGMVRPIVSARILDYTFADKRATVLSLASLAGRLFFAVTAGLVGWMAKALPMDTSLLGQAALLSLTLIVLLVIYHRIPAKYFTVKDSVRAHQ